MRSLSSRRSQLFVRIKTRERRTCAGVNPWRPVSGFLQTALQIASYLLEERGVQVEEVRDGLQNGRQAEVLPQKLQVGKADLRLRGSGHGSTLHVGFFLLSYGI